MFVTPLQLEATLPGRWKLIHDLVWEGGQRIVVPAGFETDLASIPRLLRGILHQNGLSRAPAVLHDFLYATQIMTRSEADGVFREALEAEGMGWLGRFLYWSGVRVGGWVAWRNHAKNS